MDTQLLNPIYEQSFRDNWGLPALTEYGKKHTLNYADLALDIARTHLAFELSGIKKGDKIALIGRNSPGWIVVFIATITYGATIVPILQDFNPTDATHILNHSESVLLFVDDHIWENLEFEQMPNVRGVISLTNGKLLALSLIHI